MVTVAKPKFPYVLNKIRFITLYLILQVRIVLTGSLLATRKNLRNIIPILLGVLFLTFPGIPWADQPQWPWTLEGENFQITNIPGDNFSPSIASNGSLSLAVWYRSTPSGLDIYGVRMTSSGDILGDEIPICTAPNDQMFPVVLWDGENFFVVWQDKRSGKRWDIYGAWITIDGQVMDSAGNPTDGIPIAVGTSTYDQVSPVLSYDGENYLVAWQGKRTQKIWNVYFAIFSKSGGVIVQQPVSPSLKDQGSPSVDFDGENYLIAWQDKRGGKFWDIYGAGVSPQGSVSDPLRITFGDKLGGDAWGPVLSWNGGYYSVFWVFSHGTNKWSLRGRRVSSEGQSLDLLDLVDIQIQSDDLNRTFPAIVWDGEEYLLVWEDDSEANSKIFGTSIVPDYRLGISDMKEISTSDGMDAVMPALSKNGNDILVVWQGMTTEGYWQIYGQRLAKLNGNGN